jgi:hypothetical protein
MLTLTHRKGGLSVKIGEKRSVKVVGGNNEMAWERPMIDEEYSYDSDFD